jgi:hypothetical protein
LPFDAAAQDFVGVWGESELIVNATGGPKGFSSNIGTSQFTCDRARFMTVAHHGAGSKIQQLCLVEDKHLKFSFV